MYYHKIHILSGKSQDAFMNNLEVFFTCCSYFRFFCNVCGKCTFFELKLCKSCRKYKDNTYKNIKIKLNCPQESYLNSFWDSWMFLMCILRWWKWENDYPQESHLKYLWSTWMVLMIADVNDLPHESHLKYLWPLWKFLCSRCN